MQPCPVIGFKFVGHAGQGVRRSALMFSKAALVCGFNSQAYAPGSVDLGDRRVSYVRVRKGEIMKKGPLDSPNFYIYFALDLFEQDLKAIPERAVIVLNVKDKFTSPLFRKKKLKVLTLDATGIALRVIGRPWASAPLLGALIKGWTKIGIKALKSVIEASVEDKASEQSKAAEEGMRAAT